MFEGNAFSAARTVISFLAVAFFLVLLAPHSGAVLAIDSGLRLYDGSSVNTILAQPHGILTSPLRFAKSSFIYGVILVDPSSINASAARIRTASGTKALARINPSCTTVNVTANPESLPNVPRLADGWAYAGDINTAVRICDLAGYNRFAGWNLSQFVSPGDNTVMFWRNNAWVSQGADSFNSFIDTITCDMCYDMCNDGTQQSWEACDHSYTYESCNRCDDIGRIICSDNCTQFQNICRTYPPGTRCP